MPSLFPPPTPSLRSAALAVLAALGAPLTLTAQIGDNADRPGVVQAPLVPAHLIPPSPALTPEEALTSFRVAPGYRLEIAAAEPLVQEPVFAHFGPDGRLWVVEMRGYMPDLDGQGEDLPTGRIVVLRDRDADGRYDESQVFLDQLVLPRALALVDDGVLIGTPPELAFWRDTDGDGRGDSKEIVATDFGVMTDPKRPFLANPERAPNSLLRHTDNWIYTGAYTRKFRRVGGVWETAPTLFRGQWGLSQDDAGRLYHNSNSDHLRVDVIPSDYLKRNPHFPRLPGANVNAAANQLVWSGRVNPGINRGYRQDFLREDGRLKEFTAACGPWIYRGDLLPEFYGNAFVAEPAGNLIRRSTLTAADGTVRAANAHERGEFITSTDERFRPVNFTTGPDGALYIVDLYRGVLQHRISLTSYLRRQSEDQGLATPLHRGRIYRLVPDGRTSPRVGDVPARPLAAWVDSLSHPNAWWRETAQRLLVESGDRSLVPAITAIATGDGPATGRVHALWTLAGLNALDPDLARRALRDAAPLVRSAGIRLLEDGLSQPAARADLQAVLALLRDPDSFVRLQAALSTGGIDDPAVDAARLAAVLADPAHVHLRSAFLSGIRNRERTMLLQLLDSGDTRAVALALASDLAGGVFVAREPSPIAEVIAAAAQTAPELGASVLAGFAAVANASPRAVVLPNEPSGWAQLAALPAATKPVSDLATLLRWSGKPGLDAVAQVAPLTPAQEVRFANGRALFAGICAACHQADGRGLDGVAPPLLDSHWVLGPPERTIRIVLHGVRGPIVVLNHWYTGDMPGLGGLDDHQISSVLTYLRREWGHTASAVEPEDVAAVRAATAGRNDAWTQDELNLIKPAAPATPAAKPAPVASR